MEEETRYTKQDLETMRAWTLQRKIQVTQTRLIEWLGRYDWNVYVSFSGGKDSTVLADLAARVYQVFSCPKRQDPLRLVFVNTGLEYPEIQKFVRDFAEWLKAKYKIPVELEILHPSMTFPQVLSKYGYPVISKETAKVIYYARRGSRWAINRLDGLDKHGNESKFKERFKKYKFLIDAPFETSQLCCDVMKKGPAHRYEAETGRKPIVATMTEESEQRQSSWLKYGCNSFDSKRPMSKPMSFWTEQDVLQYDTIIRHLSPEFTEELKADRINLSTAYELAGLPAENQNAAFKEYHLTGAISIKAAREWKRPAPPAPPAEDTATPTQAERPQKEREPVVERDKVPDTQATPPYSAAVERDTADGTQDTKPTESTQQSAPRRPQATRSSECGICPYCGAKFDAAKVIEYSIRGAAEGKPHTCQHCGRRVKIFCSVSYFCSPAEE